MSIMNKILSFFNGRNPTEEKKRIREFLILKKEIGYMKRAELDASSKFERNDNEIARELISLSKEIDNFVEISWLDIENHNGKRIPYDIYDFVLAIILSIDEASQKYRWDESSDFRNKYLKMLKNSVSFLKKVIDCVYEKKRENELREYFIEIREQMKL